VIINVDGRRTMLTPSEWKNKHDWKAQNCVREWHENICFDKWLRKLILKLLCAQKCNEKFMFRKQFQILEANLTCKTFYPCPLV
jgi:hypothetical protein